MNTTEPYHINEEALGTDTVGRENINNFQNIPLYSASFEASL